MLMARAKRHYIPGHIWHLTHRCHKREFFEADSYDQLRDSHRGWVEEYLGNGTIGREGECTDSIAIGSKAFIAKVKMFLGFKAKGRHILKGAEGYHLREEAASYMALSRAEKDNIGPENTYFWDITT